MEEAFKMCTDAISFLQVAAAFVRLFCRAAHAVLSTAAPRAGVGAGRMAGPPTPFLVNVAAIWRAISRLPCPVGRVGLRLCGGVG